MPSITSLVLALTALTPIYAQTLSYVGCYNTNSSFVAGDVYDFQTDGWCQEICIDDHDDAPVLALTLGSTCLCGTVVPSSSNKVDDSNCDTPCDGYGTDYCGGNGYWSVYLTGTDVAYTTASASSSSASSTTSTASATSSTAAKVVTSITSETTVVVTASASASSSAETTTSDSSTSSDSSKSHTVGIVAGVVVAVVVTAVLAGAAVFFFRRRNRRVAEQQQENKISGFVTAKSPIPAMSNSQRSRSSPETRYDAEAMANRRLSDGSIADNEDFSRRILTVTNPDDRA